MADDRPVEEVWRLRDPVTGRVQSCELRDNSKAVSGWAVTLLQNDEPLFSRWCVDERGARDVADSLKKETLSAGWVEAPR
jgi:hypothetical protein